MSRMVLQFHNWRRMKPDDDHEFKALFLFTLMTDAERRSGVKPDHNKTFWTEVRLSNDLAGRGRWASLSEDEKIRAMYCFAREKIQEAGRKLREAPMFWTPASPLRDGPPWDLSAVRFPKPEVVEFDEPQAEARSALHAREAAGLNKG